MSISDGFVAPLVDEYRLVITPVALGRGLPLFKDLPAPVRLRLVQATTYDTGAARHVYRPAVSYVSRRLLRFQHP